MKKSTVCILTACLLVLGACKKHSSSPAIINEWVFTNVSGTSSYNLSSTTGALTTYSDSSNIITESTWYPAISYQSVSTYQLITEVWTFSGDGTFTINEIYVTSPGSGNGPVAANSSGTWAYSDKADSAIILSGGSSYILSNITNTNEYSIHWANNSTLELTADFTAVNSSGDTEINNVILKFNKG